MHDSPKCIRDACASKITPCHAAEGQTCYTIYLISAYQRPGGRSNWMTCHFCRKISMLRHLKDTCKLVTCTHIIVVRVKPQRWPRTKHPTTTLRVELLRRERGSQFRQRWWFSVRSGGHKVPRIYSMKVNESQFLYRMRLWKEDCWPSLSAAELFVYSYYIGSYPGSLSSFYWNLPGECLRVS